VTVHRPVAASDPKRTFETWSAPSKVGCQRGPKSEQEQAEEPFQGRIEGSYSGLIIAQCPMLIALPQEHRSNFYGLRELAKWIQEHRTVPASDMRAPHVYCFLRFYAAESGLKYLLSKAARVPHRHELTRDDHDEETVEGFGHDVRAMAQRLRAPAAAGLGYLGQTYKLAGGYKHGGVAQSFPVAQSHEAWRYGLVVNPDDQTELEAGLTALIEWIEQEVGYA
jgi:hypothetical protein